MKTKRVIYETGEIALYKNCDKIDKKVIIPVSIIGIIVVIYTIIKLSGV